MNRAQQHLLFFGLAIALIVGDGCTRHEVEVKPVEIKPIHITIDVNVKIDRALDDYFQEIDQAATEDIQQ